MTSVVGAKGDGGRCDGSTIRRLPPAEMKIEVPVCSLAGIGGHIPQEISDDQIYSFLSEKESLLDEAPFLEV